MSASSQSPDDPHGLHRDAEAAARLSAIVESCDDAIISKTLDGIITSWNYAAERIFGYTGAELIGQSISQLIPPDLAAEETYILDRLKAGQRIEHYETVRIAKSGKFVNVSLTISPIRDATGSIVGASKIARDITLQKRASVHAEAVERMRLAIEAAQIGIWDWELSLGEIVWSDRFAKMFGIGALIGDREIWEACLLPGDRASMREKIDVALKSHSEYRDEYRVIWADGSIHWIECRGNAIYDPDGKARRMIGTSIDVTDRRKAQEAMQAAEQRLAHLSRVSTMGNMASGLAHELNQPLGAILNYTGACTNLARLSPVPVDKFLLALGEVMNETRRAAAIIARIREFVTKQAPRTAAVDLEALIRKSLALLDFELREHGVVPTLEFDGSIPPVLADEVQIEQVLVNLVLNALQAMDETPVARRNIVIRARRSDREFAEVSVIDTGQGMPPERLSRLFEAFFTTKSQGMGMGLNISRSIVESHGGKLSASVLSSEGMQFSFTLPIDETSNIGRSR